MDDYTDPRMVAVKIDHWKNLGFEIMEDDPKNGLMRIQQAYAELLRAWEMSFPKAG